MQNLLFEMPGGFEWLIIFIVFGFFVVFCPIMMFVFRSKYKLYRRLYEDLKEKD